jgi:hypothetical protein
MAHVRQELALGAAGLERRISCVLELGIDPAQLVLGAQALRDVALDRDVVRDVAVVVVDRRDRGVEVDEPAVLGARDEQALPRLAAQ